MHTRRALAPLALAGALAVTTLASGPARATTQDTSAGGLWGLDTIDQRDGSTNGSYEYTATGAGVDVYVVDTGVDASHAEFGGRVTGGTNTWDGGSTDDCQGHGTEMAGLVGSSTYGVAKGVTIIPVRAQGCDYNSRTSNYVAAMDWIVANHQAASPPWRT